MFEEAISLLSIWASMNSWLTPTVLFLLLNLMIGTIAVTSSFTSSKPQLHHHSDLHLHLHHQQQQPPQLTRSPSILHRLRSLNFYSYIQTPQPIQTHHQSPPSIAAADPIPEPLPHPSPPVEEDAATDDDEAPTMEEVYTRIIQKQSNPHYGRQNSDTKPTGGELPIRLAAKIKKCASDKSAFNHFQHQPADEAETTMETFIEERENAVGNGGGGTEVDARADDFINRFREHLKMQRLESIVRSKEMISGGTAK